MTKTKTIIKTKIKSAAYIGPDITLQSVKVKDMTKPVRLQRKEWLGWKCPANAFYCGRPTKYGNPFKVERFGRKGCLKMFRAMLNNREQRAEHNYPDDHTIRRELKGLNLVCWCKLDEDCHVDDLLRIANS